MLPVLIQVGSWSLFSYGALIMLGGALSTWFWLSRWKAMGLRKREDVWLLVNFILIFGYVGGKLLFVVEYGGSLLDPNKGFSVMGAFGSVALSVFLYSRYVGVEFTRLLDYVCQAAPFWHAFGRFGCFLAGCCYGRPTDAPWGVAFTHPAAMVPRELLGARLHPAQLYEAAGDLLIAASLFFFILPRVEAGRLRRGAVAAGYFGAYALLRFGLEPFRGDTVELTRLGLTAAQALSLALAAAAAAVILAGRRAACSRS